MPCVEERTRQEALGDRLRSLREAYARRIGRKIYQRDVAKLLGINEDTYRAYEYGRAQLPEEVARTLAGEWGYGWQEFYQTEAKVPETGPPLAPAFGLFVPIPYIGGVSLSSKADWTDPLASLEWRDVPPEMATVRDLFACTALTDSMFDMIWPGDLLVFKATPHPKIGKAVMFRSNDNFITVKQLKHDGTDYILHALNPKYEDERAEGTMVGILIGIIRQVGTRRMTIFDPDGIT